MQVLGGLSGCETVFTSDISCRVRLGRMRVEGPALIIDLGRNVQTSAAVYRVDSGAAVRAETDPFNAQYQTRMSAAAPLDNPSAGRIAIAVSTLKSARTVWIRPTPSASPRPFDISGLDSATTAAAAAGCP